MGYQINLHVPPGMEDFRTLSPENFVSITKHEGTFTTTDIYYQPSFKKAEGKKENFLDKVSKFTERLKGFKPAGSSGSLFTAFSNINRDSRKKNEDIGGSIANRIAPMMHKLATSNTPELSDNGITFTLVNWTEKDGASYVSNFAAPDEKAKNAQQKKVDAELQQIEDELKDIKDIQDGMKGL